MRSIIEQVINWSNQCGRDKIFVLICIMGNGVIEKKILLADTYSEAITEAEKVCKIHDWKKLGILKAEEFLKLSNYVGWSVGWQEVLEWKEGKTTLYYHNCPHCGHKAFTTGKPRRVCTKCHRSLRGNFKVLNWKDVNG